MDLWDNALVRPPFAANPPLKVNVNAKIYGLVIGILAALGALFGLFSLFATFSVSSSLDSFCATYGGCATHSAVWLATIGALVSLIGSLLAAFGGFQMYQLQLRGRAMIVYGMLLGILGSILYLIGWGFGFYIGSVIVTIIIYAVIYYFLVISRFPNEAPLVAGSQGYGQQPPYGTPPQQSPPQQGGYPQQGYGQPQVPPQQPPQQYGPPQQGPPPQQYGPPPQGPPPHQ